MDTKWNSEPERSLSDTTAIAIVGAGSIGIAWAVVFADAGFEVRIHDLDDQRLGAALGEAAAKLADLEAAQLLSTTAECVLSRITVRASLAEAVDGAGYVQECIVEQLDAKQALFRDLDRLTPGDVILASSTSAITATRFASELPSRDRCLVVHPGNPPYFLRVAEIVPAPFTSPAAITSAKSLLQRARVFPVILNHEIEGFVFNRLQGALLREAYCLVRDGVISAVDLDTLVREGLGRRWSIIGPFATSELNTRGGLRRHAELLGPVYARLGIERGTDNPWTAETIEHVAQSIQESLPFDTWEENVDERDRTMIEMSSLLKRFDNPLAVHKST